MSALAEAIASIQPRQLAAGFRVAASFFGSQYRRRHSLRQRDSIQRIRVSTPETQADGSRCPSSFWNLRIGSRIRARKTSCARIFRSIRLSPKPLELCVHTGEHNLQVCSHGSVSFALTQRVKRCLDALPLLLHRGDRKDSFGMLCSSMPRSDGDNELPRIRVAMVFCMHFACALHAKKGARLYTSCRQTHMLFSEICSSHSDLLYTCCILYSQTPTGLRHHRDRSPTSRINCDDRYSYTACATLQLYRNMALQLRARA